MNAKLHKWIYLLGIIVISISCENNNEEPIPIPQAPMICPSDSLVMVDYYHSMKGDEWERPWDLPILRLGMESQECGTMKSNITKFIG